MIVGFLSIPPRPHFKRGECESLQRLAYVKKRPPYCSESVVRPVATSNS